MKSYKNVFGRSKTYGLLSGNSKDTDADILFATMQMMSKEEVMTLMFLQHLIIILLLRLTTGMACKSLLQFY